MERIFIVRECKTCEGSGRQRVYIEQYNAAKDEAELRAKYPCDTCRATGADAATIVSVDPASIRSIRRMITEPCEVDHSPLPDCSGYESNPAPCPVCGGIGVNKEGRALLAQVFDLDDFAKLAKDWWSQILNGEGAYKDLVNEKFRCGTCGGYAAGHMAFLSCHGTRRAIYRWRVLEDPKAVQTMGCVRDLPSLKDYVRGHNYEFAPFWY